MEGRKQFTFYRSFYDAVMLLPKRDRYDLLIAIARFALDGEDPEGLNKAQMGLYVLIRPVLRSGRSKAANGALGAAITNGKLTGKLSGKLSGKKEKEIEKEIEIETESEGEGFIRFWDRYPVKLGRDEAEAQWECARERYGEKRILDGLNGWIRSRMWIVDQGRFIPKAEKWLREEWFLQKPGTEPPRGASGELGEAEREAIRLMFTEE